MHIAYIIISDAYSCCSGTFHNKTNFFHNFWDKSPDKILL